MLYSRWYWLWLFHLVLVSHSGLLAQDTTWFRTRRSTEIPASYRIQGRATYEKFIRNLASCPYKERDKQRYAEEAAYYKRDLLNFGNVYYNWPELEQYLNAVLHRILPDSLKANPSIHVYPTTNPSPNAYATHDGSLFFQIGLLPALHNEAELAYTLGHELAHYLHQDALHYYFLRAGSEKKMNRVLGFTQRSILNKSLEFGRSRELAADSLGFYLASQAGYHPAADIRLVELLFRFEKREYTGDLSQFQASNSKLSTHPQAEERKKLVEGLVRQSSAGGCLFAVNESLFHTLQQQATYEKLNQLAETQQLFQLQEEAFKHYLLHPDQSRIIELNLETLRKILYTYPSYKDRGFLTTRFQSKVFAKNEGVLRNLNYLFVDDSASVKQTLRTEVYNNGQPLFDTYLQAFEFFAKKAMEQHLKESLLTMALFHHQNKPYRDRYLTEYLQAEGIRHRAFAEAWKKGRLFNTSHHRDLVLIDEPTFLEEHFYGYRNLLMYGEERKPALLKAFRQTAAVQQMQKQVSYLYEEYQEHLSKTAKLYGMMNVLSVIDDSNIQYLVLPLYEPAYWEWMNEHQVRSIEIVSVTSLDEKTKKYRPWWLVPPLTPIGLIKQYCGLVYPRSRRYDFSIQYWSLYPSDRFRNAQTSRKFYYRKATDRRLAKRFAETLAYNEKVRYTRLNRLKKPPI
jgi:Zn-dependent protease with chaperone function